MFRWCRVPRDRISLHQRPRPSCEQPRNPARVVRPISNKSGAYVTNLFLTNIGHKSNYLISLLDEPCKNTRGVCIKPISDSKLSRNCYSTDRGLQNKPTKHDLLIQTFHSILYGISTRGEEMEEEEELSKPDSKVLDYGRLPIDSHGNHRSVIGAAT